MSPGATFLFLRSFAFTFSDNLPVCAKVRRISMELHLYRALWGVTRPWIDVVSALPGEGFTGVEAPLEHLNQIGADFIDACGARAIPQIFTEGNTVSEHVQSFAAQLEASRIHAPVFVNCHGGRDSWDEQQAVAFYRDVLSVEADLGIPVSHETHRGRVLYNPWITARLLDRFDALQLCCDFSHWVCVCERLIDDQQAVLEQCAYHALHLHARIGFGEGPQVPDPRAPEYAGFVEAHERWWDLIWKAQRARGFAFSTLTPEFGPPPYLHTLPYTGAPVADLWEINDWQAERQARRFKAFSASL